MSKAKSKKSAKDDVKGKAKDLGEEKKAETNDEAGAKQSPVKEWSDWKWDEGLKLFYRAKPANGGERVSSITVPQPRVAHQPLAYR